MNLKFSFIFSVSLTVTVFLISFNGGEANNFYHYPTNYGNPAKYSGQYGYGSYSSYCEKCGPQPDDCNSTSPQPIGEDGNPECTCNPGNFPPGCTLKPCSEQDDPWWACDCEYADPNDLNDKALCYNYKCVGDDGACETCKKYDDGFPPNCTSDNFDKPPAEGGAACSCMPGIFPKGCTLPPCTVDNSGGDTICICTPNINSAICVHARCPGSSKASS